MLLSLTSTLVAEETQRKSPWNLPAGLKTIPVKGYPMAYVERGKGPTVILVHGALAEPAILSLLPNAAGNEARAAQVKHLNARFTKGDTEGALEFFVDSVNAPGTWKNRPESFRKVARDNVWTISRQATDIERMGVAGVTSLTMPVLLIGGERSPRMFTEILDALNKELPTSKRETLPDAGHQVSRDNPPAFNRALTGFLSK